MCEASTASLLMRVDFEMEYARIDALSLTFSMPTGVLAGGPAQTAMLGQSPESTPGFISDTMGTGTSVCTVSAIEGFSFYRHCSYQPFCFALHQSIQSYHMEWYADL